MKRGRPKADYSDMIGREFNRLKIVAITRSDKWGHPRCRTKCLICRKLTTKRLQSVLSGASISCGCLGKRKFAEHWRRRAAELSNHKVESIWCAVRAGTSIKATARDLGLNKYLVSFAAQAHQRRLDSMTDRQVDSIWEAAQRKGTSYAAKESGLDPRSVGYLVSRRHKATPDPAADPNDLSQMLEWLETEKSLKPDWDDPFGARQHEFTSEELSRKANGQITGTYTDLYRKFKRWRPSHTTDPKLADLVQSFLEMAEGTFAARRERPDGKLKQLREEAKQKRERQRILRQRGLPTPEAI
jgi:hypothetical protein